MHTSVPDGKVLGHYSHDELQEYNSALLENWHAEYRSIFNNDPDQAKYLCSEHFLAFIAPDKQLVAASTLEPDTDLIDERIDLSLDRFYVKRYPGQTQHTIQVNFAVDHLVSDLSVLPSIPSIQEVLYGYSLNVNDNQAAPIIGASIFRGLRIQNDLQMMIETIHIADPVAQPILDVLQNDAMKVGLTLLSTLNPVFDIVSNLIDGCSKLILSKKANVGIGKILLGLSLDRSRTTLPKLQAGSYVLIQAPSNQLSIDNYVWNSNRARIDDRRYGDELPWNYMVFSIHKSKI